MSYLVYNVSWKILFMGVSCLCNNVELISDESSKGGIVQEIMDVFSSLKKKETINQKINSMFGNQEDLIMTFLKKISFKCPVINHCQDELLSFHLYTRSLAENPYLLNISDTESLKNAPIEKSASLKFIVHEFWGHKDSILNEYLRREYFKYNDYNIVSMDYELLVKTVRCYPIALASLSTVGKCGAKLLDSLYTHHPTLSPDNTHVIGFSFGAHVSSWITSSLETGTVARLTVLEPALPLYDKVSNQLHHQRIEARTKFSDVYHSNIGICSFRNPVGTVDVYINNGSRQPGCNCDNECDHLRVVPIFAETIGSEVGMWGFPCPGWKTYLEGECNVEEVVLLGQPVKSITKGVYLIFTADKPPFLLPPSAYGDEKRIGELDIKCVLDPVYGIMQEN